MTPIDIICKLKELANRIAESERALSEVGSSAFLDCAAWHEAESARIRRFVDEYPRGERMSATEAVQLDSSLTMANRHERWAREIRRQSNGDAFRDLARGIIAADRCNFHDEVSMKVSRLAETAVQLLEASNAGIDAQAKAGKGTR